MWWAGRGWAWARVCEIDGRGCGGHAVWGAGAGAVLVGLVTAARIFCEIDGRGMQFGVLGAFLQG